MFLCSHRKHYLAISPDMVPNSSMKVYVKVGKQIRCAEAEIRNGKAYIPTTWGQYAVFSKWWLTKEEAEKA